MRGKGLKAVLIGLTALGMMSCAEQVQPSQEAEAQQEAAQQEQRASSESVVLIEAAQKAEAWREQEALKTDLYLEFGGKERLHGSLYMDLRDSRCRIELKDGSVAVFDGQDAWVQAEGDQFKRARFDLLTWSYFLAAPIKLTDPGAQLSDEVERPLDSLQQCPTTRLTFQSDVGDSPDDWYLIYRDPTTNYLKAMAYIVTYGKSVESANSEPHAITYEDVKPLDGIPLARTWKFWMWEEEIGLGRQLGNATISNPAFVKRESIDFSRPAKAVLAPPPS